MDFVLWFVFCVWISSFAHEQVSLFSLFSFFFLLFFLISFGLWEKKKQWQWREWENERKKKKKERRSSGENERKKKKNPVEREIIDKISSCSNILMQEIQLLMYSSKKKKGFSESTGIMNSRHFKHFLSIFYLCIGCWRCSKYEDAC